MQNDFLTPFAALLRLGETTRPAADGAGGLGCLPPAGFCSQLVPWCPWQGGQVCLCLAQAFRGLDGAGGDRVLL